MLVLAAVFVVALLVKRLRLATGGAANGIEVLAQASLGAKERAVIIRVGSERLLLGVASGTGQPAADAASRQYCTQPAIRHDQLPEAELRSAAEEEPRR